MYWAPLVGAAVGILPVPPRFIALHKDRVQTLQAQGVMEADVSTLCMWAAAQAHALVG